MYLTSFSYLKIKNHPKLRLINDFIFIALVVYGQNLNNPAALFFILLPVVNSPNHSGKDASPLLVIALTFSLFIYIFRGSILSLSKEVNTIVYILVPAGLFLIVILFESYRTNMLRIDDRFNHTIDQYYENNLQVLEKPHRILKNITQIINAKSLISFKTHRLICFKVNEQRVVVIGSSQFVYNYRIIKLREYLTNLRKNKVIENHSIEIDGIPYNNNLSILVDGAQQSFIFVLLTDRGLHLFHQILRPVFNRVARILEFENALQQQKQLYLERLKNKTEFLDDAQMAMHFIKNKLSPITNFIAMSEDSDSLTGEEKSVAFEHFKKERDKIKNGLPLILEKAERLHESSIRLSDSVNHGIKKLIVVLRANLSTFFSEEIFEAKIDIETADQFSLILHIDSLELLFTNWISNMKNNNNGVVSVYITESKDVVEVGFVNNLTDGQKTGAKKFVDDFNSTEREEIINRIYASTGLRELKYLLRTMDLDHRLTTDGNTVEFSLYFRKDHESSNHRK